MTKKGILKTPDGRVMVWYEVIEHGDCDAEVTDSRDKVKVVYSCVLKNGKVIDKDRTLTVTVGDCIRGFAESIRLIGTGGKIKFTVHPDWGYGNAGFESVPPNSTLIYEVALKEIIHYGRGQYTREYNR